MKHFTGILIFLLIAIFLAGCGTSAAEGGESLPEPAVEGQSGSPDDAGQVNEEDSQASAGSASPDVQQENQSEPPEPRQMPRATQLALGIIALDNTGHPVDASQAAEMLLFWKALRSLSESETAATAEIEGLVSQIQGTLTEEQINLIDSLDLNFQEMGDMLQEMGIEFGGGRLGNADPEMQATIQAARKSGQASEGGFGPGAGGGFGPGGGPGGGTGGEGLSPEARQTAIAERGGIPGANLGINPDLLEAVIIYLEGKTG
jgi:hypothetical protein